MSLIKCQTRVMFEVIFSSAKTKQVVNFHEWLGAQKITNVCSTNSVDIFLASWKINSNENKNLSSCRIRITLFV